MHLRRSSQGHRTGKSGWLRAAVLGASAASFAAGAAAPLLVTAVAPAASVIPLVSATSLVCLAGMGALAARTGGANMLAGTMRATFWGALAMAVTAGVGALFGTVV